MVTQHGAGVVAGLGYDIGINAIITVVAFAHFLFAFVLRVTATHGPDKGTGENSLAVGSEVAFLGRRNAKNRPLGGFERAKYFQFFFTVSGEISPEP
jgi:hypothetical protein